MHAGAGVWRPDAPALARIRKAIAKAPSEWKRATKGRTLDGESLQRPPKGFDPDDPMIADIKRKDFATGDRFSEADACRADFLARYVDGCRAYVPIVRFLCGALALDF